MLEYAALTSSDPADLARQMTERSAQGWEILQIVSNGANITDGLDGLATGVSALIGACLALFTYASGNLIFADYLNIMYIPDLGELSIFIAAMIGACIGFLWYNSYPAQVFMGDTGSLALGGALAGLAATLRVELLLIPLGGLFVIISASVILQVAYFKLTGGKRIFKMAPLQHHFELLGWGEVTIVIRFWILAGMSVAAGLGLFYGQWVVSQ